MLLSYRVAASCVISCSKGPKVFDINKPYIYIQNTCIELFAACMQRVVKLFLHKKATSQGVGEPDFFPVHGGVDRSCRGYLP